MTGERLRVSAIDIRLRPNDLPEIKVALCVDELDLDLTAEVQLELDEFSRHSLAASGERAERTLQAARFRAWQLISRLGYDPYNHHPAP